MKRDLFFAMLMVFAVAAASGCSTTKATGERMDQDQIKRNADQGMQDLQKEENRHRDTY